MKKYTYSVLLMAFVLVMFSCNKKTIDKVSQVPEEIEQKVTTWRSMAPKSGPAKVVQMGKYTQTTLDNGLKLIIVENHKLPLVNFQFALNSPPILEERKGEDIKGYVGLSGSLMSTGTTTRTKAEIDQSVDNLGASLNTSGRSATGQCLTKHIDSYLEILSDVMINPAFRQDEFEKGVKKTLSGIQSSQDDPGQIARRVRKALVFGKNHPYGKSETAKSVNNIQLDDVSKYYKKTFFPKNLYLVIVGDITPDDAKAKAEKYFGNWKNPEAMAAYAPMPKVKKPKAASVGFVNKPGAVQSTINIAYPVNIKPGAKDAIPASLMNAILGGGVFSGKLIQNLREDKAYTYGANSALDIDPHQGFFYAFANVRNEVTDSSIVEFKREMNAMRNGDFSEENLDMAKKFMTGTFARSLSNPNTVARMALNTAKYNLSEDYYKKYIEKISAVTIADIHEMAKKYITPDNAHIIVVGSKSDVSEKLTAFDADGVIDFYDTDGNYLKPTDETIPEGHTAEIVINDYIDAIGGRTKLETVQDMTTIYNADLMGRPATFKNVIKLPNKSFQEVASGSMVMQKQIFNGDKLMVSGMQGAQTHTEGDEFDKAKNAVVVVEQLNYKKDGVTISLEGIEKIEGKSNYIVKVVKANGDIATQYYDVKTNLFTKSTENIEAQGQKMTISRTMKDYADVEGIKFPKTIEITGMMPVPLVLSQEIIQINSNVSDDMFKE